MDEEIERRVLAALCQGKVTEDARLMLAGYRWREPLHQAIFQALAALPSSDPRIIRSELPARLTRLGFPDVDLPGFFAPIELAGGEIKTLIRDLHKPR